MIIDKIKLYTNKAITWAKDWYLGKWKSHKKIMIMVHIFMAFVLLGELLK